MLTTYHYEKPEFYLRHNINIVKKHQSAPSSDLLNDILALMKRKLRNTKCLADNISSKFRRNWKITSENINRNVVQTLMRGLTPKARAFWQDQ